MSRPIVVILSETATLPAWHRGLRLISLLVSRTPGTWNAEAICEAVTRANMRFVPTKTPEQQSCLMLHRTRRDLILRRALWPAVM
jgi:hypothetical protein